MSKGVRVSHRVPCVRVWARARARVYLFPKHVRRISRRRARRSLQVATPPPVPAPARGKFNLFVSRVKNTQYVNAGVYTLYTRAVRYRSSNLSFFFLFLFSDTKKRYARNPGVPEKVILMESCFIYLFFFLHRQRPLFFILFHFVFSILNRCFVRAEVRACTGFGCIRTYALRGEKLTISLR